MNYSRRSALRLMLCTGVSLSLPGCMKQAASVASDVNYYTCTMHPSVRSQDPHGKCPICGMDLVPVLKRGDGAGKVMAPIPAATNEFAVPIERQQQIGVTYTTVERRPLHTSIRAVGMVEYDMLRHWAFVARTDGYVEKLFVTSPGEIVEKDQPLVSIYSPDLLTAEHELLMLLRMRDEAKSPEARATPERLIASSRARLEQWNVTPDQLAAIEKTRQVESHFILRSPFRGFVQEVPAHQGVNVKTGDHLVDVADLSQVWIWAEVFEDEISGLQQGQKVTVTSTALAGREFDGTVSVINPFIDEATRTSRVRVDVANADFALHPGMYVNVLLGRDLGEALTVPVSAVMPTGNRNIVFVDRGNGKLASRDVRLGGKFGEYYEVRQGLKEGDRVVSSANFLIDAESKVEGALKDFDDTGAGGAVND